MTSSLRIIVSGMIAKSPVGGMAWHYLQYLIGLNRLGHDVYYFEDTSGMPNVPKDKWSEGVSTFSVEYLSDIMARIGLGDKWAYCLHWFGGPHWSGGPYWYGLSDEKRRAVIESADLLINVSGSLAQPENYRQVRRLAFVDTDPVFNQLRILLGKDSFRSQVDVHDVHFSFGERLAKTKLATGHFWRPTRQPIVISEWHPEAPRRNAFTTVMNWMVKKKPLVYDNQTYGQKDMEFIRFLELPNRVDPVILELALTLGKEQVDPRRQLVEKGWHVVNPQQVCPTYDSYRTYIESSMAEWSVSKNGYVQGQSGWFSERSACYLAAGKPAVVQDTGFKGILPVGEGLLPFTIMEEAVTAIDEVVSNYSRHARAARVIAEEYFDSNSILTRLVEEALSDDAGLYTGGKNQEGLNG